MRGGCERAWDNTGLDLSFITPGARSDIAFTPLLSFNDTNGAELKAGVAGCRWQLSTARHYGGGDYDLGTVYQADRRRCAHHAALFRWHQWRQSCRRLGSGRRSQLYGTTYDGGANDLDNGGDGTVFKITTNGFLTTLASFNGPDGSHPAAGLVQGADGRFYGTTYDGGINDLENGGDGTVFKITANGTLTSLVSFNGTNGANPAAGLTLAADGNFYGTTEYGGTYDVASGGDGTVFRITTNGLLTSLISSTAPMGPTP